MNIEFLHKGRRMGKSSEMLDEILDIVYDTAIADQMFNVLVYTENKQNIIDLLNTTIKANSDDFKIRGNEIIFHKKKRIIFQSFSDVWNDKSGMVIYPKAFLDEFPIELNKEKSKDLFTWLNYLNIAEIRCHYTTLFGRPIDKGLLSILGNLSEKKFKKTIKRIEKLFNHSDIANALAYLHFSCYSLDNFKINVTEKFCNSVVRDIYDLSNKFDYHKLVMKLSRSTDSDIYGNLFTSKEINDMKNENFEILKNIHK